MFRLVIPVFIVLLAGCSPATIPLSDPGEILPESAVAEPTPHPAVSVGEADDFGLASASVSDVAKQAVARYFAATDAIGSDGGVDVMPMKSLVTPQWFPTEQEGFASYQNRRIRTVGATEFDHFAVQSARVTLEGSVEVAVFVCVDSSRVWVVDREAPDPPEGLTEWLALASDTDEAVAEPTSEQLESWQPYLDQWQPVAGFREPIVIWLTGPSAQELLVDGTENWRGHHPCGQEP